MNLAEVWFGIVERQAISRGVFPSVKYLNARIRIFIDGWIHRSTHSSVRKPTRKLRENQP